MLHDDNTVDASLAIHPLESASVAIVPLTDSLPIPKIAGLSLPMHASLEERLEYLDRISDYTQAVVIEFDDLEGKYFEGKNPAVDVRIAGILVKQAGELDEHGRYFDRKTGEERHAYVVLCKLDTGDILLFQSFAATNWAALLLSAVGHVGDFVEPIRFKIKQIPARIGHTYTFKRIRES